MLNRMDEYRAIEKIATNMNNEELQYTLRKIARHLDSGKSTKNEKTAFNLGRYIVNKEIERRLEEATR